MWCWEGSGLPALEINLGGLSARVQARESRSSESREHAATKAAKTTRGGCIRGFLWAMAFEAASVGMIWALHIGIHNFQR